MLKTGTVIGIAQLYSPEYIICLLKSFLYLLKFDIINLNKIIWKLRQKCTNL